MSRIVSYILIQQTHRACSTRIMSQIVRRLSDEAVIIESLKILFKILCIIKKHFR
jgi:hypothetical protein